VVRGTCPDCDALVEITPTGEPIGRAGTACYWRVVLHRRPDAPELCDGSGKKI
jgi:hypothetical protein